MRMRGIVNIVGWGCEGKNGRFFPHHKGEKRPFSKLKLWSVTITRYDRACTEQCRSDADHNYLEILARAMGFNSD